MSQLSRDFGISLLDDSFSLQRRGSLTDIKASRWSKFNQS